MVGHQHNNGWFPKSWRLLLCLVPAAALMLMVTSTLIAIMLFEYRRLGLEIVSEGYAAPGPPIDGGAATNSTFSDEDAQSSSNSNAYASNLPRSAMDAFQRAASPWLFEEALRLCEGTGISAGIRAMFDAIPAKGMGYIPL